MRVNIKISLAILMLWSALQGVAFATTEIRLLYIGSEDDTAYMGARQGLSEANLQGQFLDQKYVVDVRAPGVLPAEAFSGVAAILATVNADLLPALAASATGVPVFNLQAQEDSLRTACIANVLHVIPSEAMLQDAVAQWQKANPGAQVTASAWHGDFMKYAGRDLNKRFRAASGQAMNDASWAGWAAVKMTSDTVARLNDASPAAVLKFLRQQLKFDGQKGAEMSFRDSGQLRQPLLLIEKGKIAGEAPVRGVADADDLDSLGNSDCSGQK
ncbi:MAG: hypothetical protein A3H91_01040 [Gammaproteobacteria bacterium RIFCSPLOWO2_02_FULL_61_13]|nr:MAG: hypothetical protein A3H91_01040 [Gammaproteobacteria bacterium RIFCSPLOWO2_02_FULL_61_13]